jgi:signal transduction histidine kinase
MNPLRSEIEDVEALQELGRLSVQIVHDIKNQINGLKLYATFLRKRMEKSARPEDEIETIVKLMNGLERTATDLNLLVRYGRPLDLKLQPNTDLSKIMMVVADADVLQVENGSYEGEFDQVALTESLKDINQRVRPSTSAENLKITLHSISKDQAREAIIEWEGIRPANGGDPFSSFVGSDGLRLALAAKVVKAHGGNIELSGTKLSIRLPLKG